MHVHAHSGHGHGPGNKAGTILTWGAAATLGYVALALVMGLRAHSLALISEAAHNFTDFLALGLSWLGVYLQTKKPTASKTFGFHRAGVLAALANVVSLIVLTILIVIEAIARLPHPGPVAAGPMLWVAIVGLAMNSAIALTLRDSHHDVNLRAAFLHMLGDALATALVIVGAVVIARTGAMRIDPILSLVIAALILVSGWGVLRETLNILLEGVPAGMKPEQIAAELVAVEGVQAVHDLHIWSLGAHAHALSAHVQIADIPPSLSEAIRLRMCAVLDQRFHIHHATLQFENAVCQENGHCHFAAPHCEH